MSSALASSFLRGMGSQPFVQKQTIRASPIPFTKETRRPMKKRFILLVVLFFANPAIAWAATLNQEIAHLIHYTQASSVVFIRNGSEHTPKQAAEHMQKKREHFQDKIKTTEDFIALAATKSLASGEPYRVRHPSGQTEECGPWLRRELERFRKQK
jgi:hypothetical protein